MIDVRIYLATPMTGYDRPTMIRRAFEMVTLGKEYGVRIISPVLEECIEGSGALIQNNEVQLFTFWKRDKEIIRNRDGSGAHVVLIDKAHLKSYGCEREYGFNRYCLWKPTVCIVPSRSITVAQYEDDAIFTDERSAFQFIATQYGTRAKRWKWRAKMLIRSLPGFLLDQFHAWR